MKERLSRAAVATLTSLLVGGALAIVALLREVDVLQAEQALTTQVQLLARQGAFRPDIEPIDTRQPARALILEAQSRLILLPYVSDGGRKRIMVEARRAVDRALLQRPKWGEAKVLLAYLEVQRGEAGLVSASKALAASYKDAKYLVGAAEWRVAAGVSLWPHLLGESRHQLVNEAVWAARLDHHRRARIFAIMRQSAAYVPFVQRWREVRALDKDLAPG